HVQNEVEDLLPHLSDGCFTGSHAAGGNVDQIEPVLLHLVAAAHLDHRGHVQPVGSAAAGHEHLQADAAGQLAGAAHDVAGGGGCVDQTVLCGLFRGAEHLHNGAGAGFCNGTHGLFHN